MRIGGHLESAFRFYAWALQHPKVPSARAIMDHFGVTRPTAYRYRAAYCASVGVASDTRKYLGFGKGCVSDPAELPRRPAVRLAA